LLVLGSKKETGLANQLQTEIGSGVINVTGQTTLRQSAELLARCHLFIGNDSGPMHMAAAMHVPIVGICSHPKTGSLHHERSPMRFRPWTSDYVLVQPDTASGRCSDGCDARSAHCIRNVTVDMVHYAATQQLANGLHAATIGKGERFAGIS
jgi:heptosyltransferase-2